MKKFLSRLGSALGVPASRAKEKKRAQRNGLGLGRRGTRCLNSFHRDVNLNKSKVLAGEWERCDGAQVPARGPIRWRQRDQPRLFFLGFSLLSFCKKKKRKHSPASWGCDSASAPISSGAGVPGRRHNEARTWAKEAMAEVLREAGDEGRLKKRKEKSVLQG